MCTNWQVWQNPEVAARFAEGRRAGLPGVVQQFETLHRLIRHVPKRPLRALDLGCGDGAVLAAVMQMEPVERAVALDGSPAMLDRARARFKDDPRVGYVEADFNWPQWVEALPMRGFDLVVSGFAIHHSEDDRKQAIYAQVFELLAPGGAFVNVEHVASESPLGTTLWQEILAEHLAAHATAKGEEATPALVLRQINASGEQDANRLSPVDRQLGWLRSIGFADVDCYWRWFELAVLAGFKP